MQDVSIAIVLMSISSGVAIWFGQQPAISRTGAYCIGLATMLVVTLALFVARTL